MHILGNFVIKKQFLTSFPGKNSKKRRKLERKSRNFPQNQRIVHIILRFQRFYMYFPESSIYISDWKID